MNKPRITNRKGPSCELTVRVKFDETERFRQIYREQLEKGYYFIKSSRTKPEGTRLQLIFVLEDQEQLEIWTWGAIEEIVTSEQAASTGTAAGLRIKLMDLTAPRKRQIEQLFGVDEAVAAITQRHQSSSPEANIGYTKVSRSARQEQIANIDSFLKLAEKADHYVLLGIPKNADEQEIRAAFRDRTKKYHPDQHFRKIPEDMQKELSEVYQKIQNAYRTLLDPKRRATYDTSIGNYANPEVQRRAMPHVRMQEKFKEIYQEIIGPRAELIRDILKQVDKHIAAKEYRAARNKLKLASAYDPLNRKLKKRLKELDTLLPKAE